MFMMGGALSQPNTNGPPSVNAQDREIEVTSDWAPLLDASPPKTQCENLGGEGSKYDMRQQTGHYGAVLLRELFTEEECKRLIAASEKFGYGFTDYPKSYRGNTRLISTDKGLAEAVWERIRPHVPARLTVDSQDWEAVGLNECWRMAKYVPGDRFKGHTDAAFSRGADEMSMFTVNAYMNGDFTQGRTRFFGNFDSAGEPDFAVAGAPGLCCVFRQPPGATFYHDGEELGEGIKYLFRSDVMYRKVLTMHSADAQKHPPCA
jgi:hypothetical protein